MFSGTVPDYLFIYVFLLFPEVQKCYVFRHCARLFVYVFLLFPEMLCFQALCQIICLCISIISRNVMFSGTVPDYLCISIISRSPEILCFQALCQIICLFMYLFIHKLI